MAQACVNSVRNTRGKSTRSDVASVYFDVYDRFVDLEEWLVQPASRQQELDQRQKTSWHRSCWLLGLRVEYGIKTRADRFMATTTASKAQGYMQ